MFLDNFIFHLYKGPGHPREPVAPDYNGFSSTFKLLFSTASLIRQLLNPEHVEEERFNKESN